MAVLVNLITTVGIQGPRGEPGPAYVEPSSPVFTYVDTVLTRVDYADGSFKQFEYQDGNLTTMTTNTVIKTFVYTDGLLTQITETPIV